MRRSVPMLFLLLATAGCQEDVVSRISMELPGELSAWPMDLNPDTSFSGVDNTVTVEVTFEAASEGLTRPIEWQEYQIEYGLAGELAPVLNGVFEDAEQQEGETFTLILEGLGESQLDWVATRYQGGEFLVPFRVSLTGQFNGFQGVIAYEEFNAVFADYK